MGFPGEARGGLGEQTLDLLMPLPTRLNESRPQSGLCVFPVRSQSPRSQAPSSASARVKACWLVPPKGHIPLNFRLGTWKRNPGAPLDVLTVLEASLPQAPWRCRVCGDHPWPRGKTEAQRETDKLLLFGSVLHLEMVVLQLPEAVQTRGRVRSVTVSVHMRKKNNREGLG